MVSPAERTSAALAALAAALEATAAELDELAARAHVLRRAVDAGTPLTEAMAAEERPLIITRLVHVTDRLNDTGGEVRRAEAHQLRAEGRTQEQIAAIMGVTRQRAGALLKPVAERRPPKRPRPQTPQTPKS